MSGKLGRPPKTTAKHLQDGTYRADRHGDRADHAGGASLPESPPDGLGQFGRALWCQATERLRGIAVAADMTALYMLCDWWDQFQEISAAIAGIKGDMTSKEYASLTRQKVAIGQRIEALASRFGLSPADHARLRIEQKEDDDELAEMERMRAERSLRLTGND